VYCSSPSGHIDKGETKPAANERPPLEESIIVDMSADAGEPPTPVQSPPLALQSTPQPSHHSLNTSFPSSSSPPRFNVTPLKLALPPTSAGDSSSAPADAFAQVIRERTRQRRAQEDAAVSELRVQVTRLEAALAAESKRRVAAVQQIHQQSVTAVAEMEARLETRVQDEMARVHERLSVLEERCQQLEHQWAQDVRGVEDTVQHNSQQLKQQLAALQQSAAAEKQQRASREQRLRAQMQEISDSYQERWKQERQDRMAAIGTLQETMESVHNSRQSDVATFEGRLTRELEQLKVAMEREHRERHASDEEITDAVNRYVQQLQESLAAASGAAYY